MNTPADTAERPGSDDDLLAAEYVLHLLTRRDRVRAEDRLDRDGAFRARVAAWTERLATMADEVEPVDPPPGLRARVARIPGPAPESASTVRASAPRGGGLGARILAGLLGGGLAAALGLVLLAVVLPQVDAPGAPTEFAADVVSAPENLVVRARYDPEAAVLTISRESGQAPEGRALQMWLLTEDQPPHAVGILSGDDDLNVPVTPFWGQRIPSGRFAVSVEDPGGSTDDVGPTGEILAVGDVERR